MEKYLKLDEILTMEYQICERYQVQVSTVWSSEIPTNKCTKQCCRFTFWDGEDYIAGILPFKEGENSEARNICRILQEKSCQFKLKNFQVKTNLGQQDWVTRGHSKHIVLSTSIYDVTQLPMTSVGHQTFPNSIQQRFPFRFTALDQIDKCCSDQLIDVLVYTTEVSKTEKTRNTGKIAKEMSVCSVRSKNPNKTGFERTITIFGNLVKERLNKSTVYALYNVMVDDNTSSIKSLHTTGNSIILKAILSHGRIGLVEMTDGKFVPLSKDIIHQFDRRALPEFAGKPKVFLIQACKSLPTEEDCRQTVIHNKRKTKIDLENMIECYATTSGDTARRDVILGSHFIYVFVDQLMKHAHDTDLVTILTRVQHYLANKILSDENHKLHCEWTPHSFNKKLFFNPGL